MCSPVLKLFVTGRNRLADRAQRNLRRVRDAVPDLDVTVVDILESPEEAEQERIVATPLLIRVSPPPQKRLFGDLSDVRVVLSELDLWDDGSSESLRAASSTPQVTPGPHPEPPAAT